MILILINQYIRIHQINEEVDYIYRLYGNL